MRRTRFTISLATARSTSTESGCALPDSPKRNGLTIPEKQLFYRSEDLALFANQAQMEYTDAEGRLRPSVLTLSGNIRLFSADENKPRFAVGDRMSLSTTTRTLILTANPGKRVLYTDDLRE
jgi:hypothetical protein